MERHTTITITPIDKAKNITQRKRLDKTMNVSHDTAKIAKLQRLNIKTNHLFKVDTLASYSSAYQIVQESSNTVHNYLVRIESYLDLIAIKGKRNVKSKGCHILPY